MQNNDFISFFCTVLGIYNVFRYAKLFFYHMKVFQQSEIKIQENYTEDLAESNSFIYETLKNKLCLIFYYICLIYHIGKNPYNVSSLEASLRIFLTAYSCSLCSSQQ